MRVELLREENSCFVLNHKDNGPILKIYPDIKMAWYIEFKGKKYKLENAKQADTIITEIKRAFKCK